MTTEVGIPKSFCETVQAHIGERHLETAIEVLEDYPFEQEWGSHPDHPRAGGRLRAHLPVELAHEPGDRQGGARSGRRLHHGAEAQPDCPSLGSAARRGGGRSRRARRRVQPGERPRLLPGRRLWPVILWSTWSRSPAPPRWGRRWPAPRPASVKRVSQELGGKSAYIVFEDVDLEKVVAGGVKGCMRNSGQSCNAPTRMLVAQAGVRPKRWRSPRGWPTACGWAIRATRETFLGPVAGQEAVRDRAGLHQSPAVDEGARLVAGGPERPAGLQRGYYVQPTVFADVTTPCASPGRRSSARCCRSSPFDDEEEAIALANDSDFGLSGYVSSGDVERARRVARACAPEWCTSTGRAPTSPRPSAATSNRATDREWGRWGLEDFLEVKAVMGYRRPEKK